jgi:hypothetical protein
MPKRHCGDLAQLDTTALIVLITLFAGGCGQSPTDHRYAVLSGKVLLCDAEIGELNVLVTGPADRNSRPDQVHCVVNQDSEVYVNDRFASLREMRVDDAVELIGYREPDRRLESFVVRFAYCRQPLSPAVVPSIFTDPTPATSSARTEPPE